MGLFWLQQYSQLQWLSPGKGTSQMTSLFSLGPSNVQPIIFLSSPPSPPRLPHELIQKLAHLTRLARGQLVGQGWQERGLAEVGGQAKSWHLLTLQSGSCQGQQPVIFETLACFVSETVWTRNLIISYMFRMACWDRMVKYLSNNKLLWTASF